MIYDTEYDGTRHDKGVYDWAVRSKERLSRNDAYAVREIIAMGMVPFPGTSYETDIEIWFSVFSHDTDMCERFTNEITDRHILRQQYSEMQPWLK